MNSTNKKTITIIAYRHQNDANQNNGRRAMPNDKTPKRHSSCDPDRIWKPRCSYRRSQVNPPRPSTCFSGMGGSGENPEVNDLRGGLKLIRCGSIRFVLKKIWLRVMVAGRRAPKIFGSFQTRAGTRRTDESGDRNTIDR